MKASPKLYFSSLKMIPCAETRTHKARYFLLFLSLFIETSSPAVSIISGSTLTQIPLPQAHTQQNQHPQSFPTHISLQITLYIKREKKRKKATIKKQLAFPHLKPKELQ